MLVVSDTSPIINLAVIGYLHLLPELFVEIIIPHAVYQEIVVDGAGEPGAEEISQASWVKVVPNITSPFPNALYVLDLGEVQAIQLAVALHADYILMDESAGRRVAIEHKLRPLGLLGILLLAKEKALVPSVTTLMDRLKLEANFFISSDLYQFVKNVAQE
jgi:hypothetical protein